MYTVEFLKGFLIESREKKAHDMVSIIRPCEDITTSTHPLHLPEWMVKTHKSANSDNFTHTQSNFVEG